MLPGLSNGTDPGTLPEEALRRAERVPLLRQRQLEAVEQGLEPDLELLVAAVLAEQPAQADDRRVRRGVGLRVGRGDGGAALVQRFLDGSRLRPAGGRLEQQLAEEKAA